MNVTDAANALLEGLYQASGGDLTKIVQLGPVAQQQGVPPDLVTAAGHYLRDYGFLEFRAIGGMVCLTTRGLDAVEQIRPDPDAMADRLTFLLKSVEVSQHRTSVVITDMWQVGEELGWDRGRTRRAFDYLHRKGLLEARALGGVYSITTQAVDIVERAEAHPDRPIDRFPPLSSLHLTIEGSTIVGSAIGSPGATVTTGDVTIGQTAPPADLREAMMRLRDALLASDVLSDAERHDAAADCETAIAQLGKSEPNQGLISALWQGLQGVISKAVVTPAVAEASRWVQQHLQALLGISDGG